MKLGKRARLLCSRMRSFYDSPGAVLRPPAPPTDCEPDVSRTANKSWRPASSLL
jgi:hypothetical protein